MALHRPLPSHTFRWRPSFWAIPVILFTVVLLFQDVIYQTWALVSLKVHWRANAADFILSAERDDFDVTFSNYTRDQLSAGEPFQDVVPPVLHHIALGTRRQDWRPEWEEALQSCVDLHPGWQTRLWTDDDAAALVEGKFPELMDMWHSYPYPIERIDALRYMILYEMGGAILDLDMRCRRALGPLRRFGFVAPEAHPTGFSISFLMASRHNPFIGTILDNLPAYNKRWFGLPYAAVMFSTGGHFASVLHALQPNRRDYKILPGPLHSLNGRVVTPLFEHLGSSSWHSYDARLINHLGHARLMPVFFGLGIVMTLYVQRRVIIRRLRL
ncbi:Glycosyltransferase, DXD sugar-binding motif protein [Metarhizium album ARSEF 1941]|uniref:Glycosyltransferase, DXD sugar-binding motif protein n=1 Tax=Metarhizium album (strain ARSEF 1941) TaxID=1081103 RepID=A0A0B2WQZ0_METAS|nr:Glycosyltransferase, DXD sugar-binding motif protein [Metarhizium album ARSEF 1941]KHN96428.1 Glycosyltransferase, DXD sugar-binding motif protein [Metarhizium album ARSEF 1941]